MSDPNDNPELSERARRLLKTLVESHIREGQPVGSRTLSRNSDLSLSAATVRNVMVDLEEMGYVDSPHTSAGRVPTAKAYRLFVDTLVTVSPPDQLELDRLQRALDPDLASRDQLADSASSLLSDITHLAGIVSLPVTRHASLRQIEFLPLSGSRILAILVINSKEVQNRILQLDREYSESELRRAANYLNEQFAGKDLMQVRQALIEELQTARDSMNAAMLDAIQIAHRALDGGEQASTGGDYVLAGQTNLMGFQELSSTERLRELFEAFTRKQDVLHLLDQSLTADGVQIFIGQESGHNFLDGCSVVSAPYTLDGEVVGVLGVIGPTRMAYQRVIPIVDITARLFGAALKSGG
ncbi:MAG: heat-inducible transcriptional repressor HrcA [Pseudomonadota bacterium]